jgi:hypothetical protein
MSEATRGLGQAAVGFAAVWLMSLAAGVGQGFSNLLMMTAGVYVILGLNHRFGPAAETDPNTQANHLSRLRRSLLLLKSLAGHKSNFFFCFKAAQI